MLFSDMDRHYDGGKMHAEPSYDYLDRSARPEATAIRAVYEDWFRGFPEANKADLYGRFSSPIGSQHVSASFELYLFQLFKRLCYSVIVHPETPSDRGTHPDFLLEQPDGERLYVEAVQSIEMSDAEQAARARLNVVFDTINRLEVYGWFLGVDSRAYPDAPPSGRRLRGQLKRWLEGLNPDTVIENVQEHGHDAYPTFTWEDGEWEIQFTAFPRSPEKRDQPVGSVLGAYFSGARWLNTWETIRDTLISKGSRYAELDASLVIAVNASVFHLDEIAIMEALFGKEQFLFDRNAPDAGPEMRRTPNGFWHGPNGARYARVGGVLVGFDIHPWTIAVRPLTLFHNPWPREEVVGPITQLSRKVPVGERMESIDGLHPRDVLGLPRSYPGIDE